MVRIEDFLTRKTIEKIYAGIHARTEGLPKARKNSWDAFFLVIFLVLIVDDKIRPAERHFFKRLKDAAFSESWKFSSLLTGPITSEQKLMEKGSKVYQIIKEVEDLGLSSIEEITRKFGKNINKKELQRITLLACVRLAISDMEVATKERFVIECLIDAWNLEELAKLIKFHSLVDDDSEYIVRDVLTENQNLMDIIDMRGLRHSQYEKAVHLIHEAGLVIPGDELVSEQFKAYKNAAENNEKISKTKAQKEYQQRLMERKKKHNADQKKLKKKLTKTKTKYGAEFICATFLPELNFHKNSFDLINEKFESSMVWSVLQKLSKQEVYKDQAIQTKKIEGKQGWQEISGIFTGVGTRASMGRIYYHDSKLSGKTYNVYVDFKIDEKLQKKVFKLLDIWKKSNFA